MLKLQKTKKKLKKDVEIKKMQVKTLLKNSKMINNTLKYVKETNRLNN